MVARNVNAGSSDGGCVQDCSCICALNSEYGMLAAACGCAGSGIAETGFDSTKVSRIASRTKSCTRLCWRKRTSVFEGWTFTSTSSAGHSRNSSAKG
jgi:hypothetical protein